MSGVFNSTLLDASGAWSVDYYSGSGTEMLFEDNETSLTCERQLVEGFPFPAAVTTANVIRYIQVVYYIITFPIGVLLNTFVVFIIIRFQQLHNITFYLALQITVTNLINAVIIFPSSAANAIANRFIFTGMCPFLGFIITFLRVARNIQMFVLVADRFFVIFMPFWYSRHRVRVVIPMSIGGWMISMVLALIPLRGLLGCYGFQRFTWSCLLRDGCTHKAACASHRTFVTTFTNIGTFLAFLLYLALLCKARKLRNRVEVSHLHKEGGQSRAILKRKQKSERRANTTFLIMFVALVGVSFPSYMFFSVGNAVLGSLGITRPPPAYAVAAAISRSMFVLIIVLDPLVVMRNSDVNVVVKTIIAKLRGTVPPNLSSDGNINGAD